MLNEAANQSEYHSLSNLLPYESYDEGNQVFINKRSAGFILEALPLNGCSEEMLRVLASVLTDTLPGGCDIQFLLWASNKVGNSIDAWQQARQSDNPLITYQAQYRADYLKQGATESLSQNGSFLSRDFRCFISVSLPINKHEAHIIEQLTTIQSELVSSFKSMQLFTKVVTAKTFLSFMRDYIYPSESVHVANPSWVEFDKLSTQLTNPEVTLEVKPNSLNFVSEHHTMQTRCLTVNQYPSQWLQAKMGELIGDMLNPALQIPCSFALSFNIHLLDKEKSKGQIEMRYLSKDSKMRSPLAKFLPTLKREYQDLQWVRERLTDGDRLVTTYAQVVMFANSDKANSCEAKIKNLFEAKGFKLHNVNYLQLQSFLASLPMMMSEGLAHDLKLLGRLKTMPAGTAANLIPIQAEFKGSTTPAMLLLARRGQIAYWSPFDNTEGNFNVAVAASSGSGKSVFVQEYIVSLLAQQGRAWVIDVGRSYEKTCKLFGGQFIEFTPSSNICINPFTHITDINAALDMLKPMFAIMARPNAQTTDEENSFLEKAIKAVWEMNSTQASVTDVAHWLEKQNNPTATNLSHLLYPYTKDGMYAKFFEGKSTLNIDNPLVVLELEELKAKKTLQEIVLLVLMYQISQAMYCGTRHQRKSCIIDEAWDLLGSDNKNSANFIETGYRRARRYNANYVTITQSVHDYYKNAASTAAFENSDSIVLLAQKQESIDQLKKSDRLSMDAYMERLLKSLKRTDDYSECLIYSQGGYSVFRLVLEPYSRILYSSKGDEFEAVKALQAKGMSLHEAVGMVAGKSL